MLFQNRHLIFWGSHHSKLEEIVTAVKRRHRFAKRSGGEQRRAPHQDPFADQREAKDKD